MFRPQEDIFREVLAQYGLVAGRCDIRPLGSGNINTTFLVRDGSSRYVLQQINKTVFPDPAAVVENFRIVTEYIAETVKSVAPYYRCAEIILCESGACGVRDSSGEWWRLQTYIDHVPAKNLVLSSGNVEKLGRTLGLFHVLTSRLDPGLLKDPLPGFHITPKYLAAFDRTISGLSDDGSDQLERALDYVDRYRYLATALTELHNRGVVSYRTIHGDPKLDNIIFSSNGSAVGLFDLDTVGPGLVLWDIGDSLRSCCNSCGESAVQPSEAFFDLKRSHSLLDGYFRSNGERMSSGELSAIYEATAVITFELGLRFLLDHLRGDVYFRVFSRGDNLRRALVQFHLLDSIIKQEKQFRTIVAKAGGRDAD